MERVRRLAGDGVPERRVLNAPPLTADQARSWGRYAGASPLYRRLIEVIASDPDLLGVLNAMESSPRPNVMLAGVQLLLLKGDGEDLARFYPNLAASARDPDDIDEPFRHFVMEHRSDLVEIGRYRRTQTNECRRCVALLPAIWALPVDSFHLVDLGTSAGLNLQMLRYHYEWGDTEWGPDSTVRLTTESRGAPRHPASSRDPHQDGARLGAARRHRSRRPALVGGVGVARAPRPQTAAPGGTSPGCRRPSPARRRRCDRHPGRCRRVAARRRPGRGDQLLRPQSDAAGTP